MFDQCLYFNTSALARQLEREWAAAFKPFGLTPPQAFMLRAVLDRPGMLQRELAEEMAIARPTATRAIDGLQAKKLVERRGLASDRRETEIHPTPEAVAVKAALNAASAAVTAKMKKVLGAGGFADVVSRVKVVRSGLG